MFELFLGCYFFWPTKKHFIEILKLGLALESIALRQTYCLVIRLSDTKLLIGWLWICIRRKYKFFWDLVHHIDIHPSIQSNSYVVFVSLTELQYTILNTRASSTQNYASFDFTRQIKRKTSFNPKRSYNATNKYTRSQAKLMTKITYSIQSTYAPINYHLHRSLIPKRKLCSIWYITWINLFP